MKGFKMCAGEFEKKKGSIISNKLSYREQNRNGESRNETLVELHFERYAVFTGSCIFLVCSPFSFLL